MRRVGPSRRVCILLGVVVLLALAGCSVMGGDGDGSDCGPADRAIEDLDAEPGNSATITGEVDELSGGNFVLDDGTGTAWVTDRSAEVAKGDCVTVTGPIDQGAALTDTDVTIVPRTLESE